MFKKKIINNKLITYVVLFLGRDVLMSFAVSSIFSIFYSIIFQERYNKAMDPWILFIGLFLFFMYRSVKAIKNEEKGLQINNLNLVLLFIIFFVGLYRSSIYFHFIDDYVQHVITGFYFTKTFTDQTIFPASTLTYIYPLLPYVFYNIISVIGFRMSLLFLLILSGTWLLSINYRCYNYFDKKKKGTGFLVNIFFIFLFFLP